MPYFALIIMLYHVKIACYQLLGRENESRSEGKQEIQGLWCLDSSITKKPKNDLYRRRISQFIRKFGRSHWIQHLIFDQ